VGYPRESNDTPSSDAFFDVAPSVRLSDSKLLSLNVTGKVRYGYTARALPVDLSFFVSRRLTCMTTIRGRKMNIDLDSWEAGYADGQYGRSPQCAIGLDQVSYLSGFCHGRARRAQSRTKSPSLLRAGALR
jgi:hypothetical protein